MKKYDGNWKMGKKWKCRTGIVVVTIEISRNMMEMENGTWYGRIWTMLYQRVGLSESRTIVLEHQQISVITEVGTDINIIINISRIKLMLVIAHAIKSKN